MEIPYEIGVGNIAEIIYESVRIDWVDNVLEEPQLMGVDMCVRHKRRAPDLLFLMRAYASLRVLQRVVSHFPSLDLALLDYP